MSEFDRNSLGKRVSDLKVSPQFNGYSGVEIIVDEETSYFAGDETGRVLSITNPWGTQTQADNILASIQGFQYQPYEATDALISPAAELGDSVTINGVYSGVYKIVREYGALMQADIEAPQDEEIDHEYPFEPREERNITRRFTQVESELAMTSSEISAKVSQTGGNNSSFGWNLLSDHFSLYSGNKEVFRVDSSGATVKGVITATSGEIGGFTIGSKAIYNNISDFSNSGNKSSGVYIGTNGIRLGKNFTVNSSGNVSANNMSLSGTLNVGGTNISASVLRSGAQTAYSNGGTWTGTTNAWNNATKSSTSSYPSYFKAGTITAAAGLYAPLVFNFKGNTISVKHITINGTMYNLLGY